MLVSGAVLAAGLPMQALAVSTYTAVSIVRLQIFQASSGATPGSLIVFTPAAPADTEGCTTSGIGYAWIDWISTLQPDGKALYASVLAAEMAGKQISISVGGCSSGNYYPLVYQIQVIN
jgi:hypothetical protein